MSGGRGRRLGTALVLATVLSGCQVLGGGPDGPGLPTGPGGTDSPTGTDGTGQEPPRTIPPQLLECGDPQAREKGGDGEQVDLTEIAVASEATWTVPAGYMDADGYYDDLAYETQTFMVTLVPQDPSYDTLDLLGVLGYEGLDWGELARECGEVPVEAMLERVQQYQEALGSQALGEAELTEVAGLPAVTQEMRIPRYDFRGYWLFSQTELLFIGCQWTSPGARTEIIRACEELVAGVQVD
ncbi:hypothetical protein LQF12_07505 [Ruania suaedae]|uniref:hypothetical protein n=1 Tax=Ruania suaedae TaxID=2897774 RepID=UPI001E5BEF70|nr:hypothetical protein [Ruania suaedae]UFU04410.1 hypothetical protein LQF12_07505 [Ruania suaedae]